MNKENRSKVLLLIIAILVVANISMLIFFLKEKEPPHKPNNRQDRKAYISAFLKNEIGFDTVQLVQYDTLSNLHRKKISSMFEKLKSNKATQFKQLVAGNFTDSTMNALADSSAITQKAIEIVMFNHLKNIKKLCKPAQEPLFDSLFVKVLNKRNDNKKKADNK
ncbi:hypothetical protein BH11BAC3_BH11BAC3_24460 [soil metagenome]